MSFHVALVHFPITDKKGHAVCTSVTNLDVHDISRAGTTYGADCVWIVHPYETQRRFLERVLRHWREGWGASYNPTRQESLARTELVADLDDMGARIEAEEGRRPILVGTSARPSGRHVTYSGMRQLMEENPEQPYCVIFGTGWGLHPEAIAEMDMMLDPVHGVGPWNHLSVRAAIGIILDRLRSPDRI